MLRDPLNSALLTVLDCIDFIGADELDQLYWAARLERHRRAGEPHEY